MSNDKTNVFERLFKLWAMICKMIMDGARAAEEVCQVLQAIVDGKTLVEASVQSDKPTGLPNINWARAYEVLGMSAELFGKARLEEDNPDLWVVPVLKGVTCNKVVEAMKKLGINFYPYTKDLDKAVSTSDRDLNRDGSYVIAFKRAPEADEENKNLSANALKDRGHKGITLLERLLLELGYFLVTGKHLDTENVTLCAGSRGSDGRVPGVCWGSDDRGVCVGWCRLGYSRDLLRSRSAVSIA